MRGPLTPPSKSASSNALLDARATRAAPVPGDGCITTLTDRRRQAIERYFHPEYATFVSLHVNRLQVLLIVFATAPKLSTIFPQLFKLFFLQLDCKSACNICCQRAGWKVGKDRVERIWRREGLKVPKKQKPRGRLWLNDGSCVRLRPTHPNHVWSYDFVSARTHDGRSVRILNLIDESTRECLLIRAERRWSRRRSSERWPMSW